MNLKKTKLKYFNWIPISFIIIVVIAIFFRLNSIDNKSLLTDEGSMILLSRGTIVQVIEGNFFGGTGHPPLQYILFHIWSRIFQGDFALRLYSAILSVFTVLLFFLSLQLMKVPNSLKILATVLLATSPLCIFYAQNMKIDAFVGFIVMLMFASFIGILNDLKRKILYSSLFTASILMALYTYYFAPFALVGMIVGQCIVSSQSRNWNWVKPVLMSCLIAILLFIPWVAHLKTQFANITTASNNVEEIIVENNINSENHSDEYPNTNNSMLFKIRKIVKDNLFLNLAKDFSIGLKPALIYGIRFKNLSKITIIFGSLLAGLLTLIFLGNVLYGIVEGLSNGEKQLHTILFLSCLVTPFFLIIGISGLLSLLGNISWVDAKRFLTPHHFLFTMPFFYVLVAQGLLNALYRNIKFIIISFLLLGSLANAYEIYSSKYTDYRTASDYVSNRWKPGDLVLGEAFSAGEKFAVYHSELDVVNFLNFEHYPWARNALDRGKKYGIFRGRQLIVHSNFNALKVRSDISHLINTKKVKRLWMFSEKGLIGDGSDVYYYDWYIDQIKTLYSQIELKEFFNVNVYCFTTDK